MQSIFTKKCYVIKKQELSDWRCLLFGATSTQGLVWRPTKGNEPNWFWRWMQFICFGNRWERVPEERNAP